MKKALLLCLLLLVSTLTFAQKKTKTPQQTDREYWVELMNQIASPVLSNMSKGELKKNMQVELSPTWDNRNVNVTYMEAFGRLMAGVAPWLALPDDDTAEGKLRKQTREMALASYRHAVDPESPDYLQWQGASQTLVDAAYIANSFMRAPDALWYPLDDITKQRYIKEFKSLRKIRTPYNNWVLFRGMIEAFFLSIGEEYDGFALDLSLRKLEEWYLGDGWYSDGTEYSLDYYNAYVMHPMVVEMTEVMRDKKVYSAISFDLALRRMQRYNVLMERLVSPEGTFPAVGRSMTYRMGSFQTLALTAWKYELPPSMTNGQVRAALTAVMKRMFAIEGNFNEKGFLQLGFVGHQPNLADYYTNNGSLYITSLVFLPLGLPAGHDFWTSAPEQWTSQKAWSGSQFLKDYHQSIKK